MDFAADAHTLILLTLSRHSGQSAGAFPSHKGVNMKTALSIIAAAITLVFASPASAYTLKNETADGCGGDGSVCIVYCENGSRAGSMAWNGSVWTDGVKWDKDKDAEAKKICAASGSDCK
jgi:hypothetical protein